ncbi:hypothetical protein [Inhella sp.]|uniref:hypothetical protein n=1 Tax=Inhella sp. TaxID=1921806 RepID=UPI0035AEA17D
MAAGAPQSGGWQPAVAYLLLALGLVLVAIWLLWPQPEPEAAPAAAPAAPVLAARPLVPAPAASAALNPVHTHPGELAASEPPSDDLAAHVPPGQAPSMKEVIERLHQAGVHTGLGAFNPPGTRPPLVGLAVPEDFVLPPGYVRHHQATDDGQRIEAVLMFDPEHPPPAAAGRSLATAQDRLVPPELAPPGLPPRRIVIPPPIEPGRAAP